MFLQYQSIPQGVEVKARPHEGALQLRAVVRQVLFTGGEFCHHCRDSVDVHHIAGELVALDPSFDRGDNGLHRTVWILLAVTQRTARVTSR